MNAGRGAAGGPLVREDIHVLPVLVRERLKRRRGFERRDASARMARACSPEVTFHELVGGDWEMCTACVRCVFVRVCVCVLCMHLAIYYLA